MSKLNLHTTEGISDYAPMCKLLNTHFRLHIFAKLHFLSDKFKIAK